MAYTGEETGSSPLEDADLGPADGNEAPAGPGAEPLDSRAGLTDETGPAVGTALLPGGPEPGER